MAKVILATKAASQSTSSSTYSSWYVDSSATGSSNGTSWSNAWTTFSVISTGILPGDTLYISGGNSSTSKTYAQVFDMTSKIRGSSVANVTVTKGVDAGHNGQVILTGNGTSTPILNHDQANHAVGWFTVSNITLNPATDGEQAIYLSGCSNWIIDTVNIQGNGDTGGTLFIYSCGNTNSTEVIRNCTITDSGPQAGQTDGIFFGAMREGATLIIEGNSIIGTNTDVTSHNDCIQMAFNTDTPSGNNKTIIIRNNHLELAGGTSYYNDVGQCIILQSVTASAGCTVYVYNNEIWKNRFRQGQNIMVNAEGVVTGKFWNNTIIGSGGFGLFNLYNLPAATEIKNNVLLVNAPSAETSYYYALQAGSWPSSGNINYNCCYRSSGSGTWAYDNGTPISKATFTANYGHDANSLNSDPLVVNAPTDMTLSSSSPAIDAGTTLSYFNTDKFGTQRPQGSAWDIGSYEKI